MAPKLTPEERVTLAVLKRKGQSNTQIAQALGVTEAAIRYHLRRQGTPDGRQNKPRKADALAPAIDHWVAAHRAAAPDGDAARPANVQALHDWLRQEYGYQGSYKSVLRFVRARYPRPRLRPYRRVETPPGAQAQVDWGEFAGLDIGDGPQTLYAFVVVLSHSRKEVLIWSRRMDQLSWHKAHNEAFHRLGGVPAVLRIDNLKTGVARGAGPWGEINAAYLAYARALGFHVDACLPRSPEHKGKVENKVRFVKRRLRLAGPFANLAELQGTTDEQLAASDARRICPATGLTVDASWRAEQPRLRPVPLLPEPFDLTATRPVQKDCTVSFEGRAYSVPFVLCGQQVEVRGCAAVVQVWHGGQVVAEHPRHTPQRLLLDPSHYDGAGDERVAAPQPLGRMGRRLQEILEMPVEKRPLDLYAALAEVSR
ncbi:MAG TPA: IS21 family transposase [Candidatus Thermoplasmatota archaeon]|nr:IS21 family transposase [Candidatus Thermoplasmatota archaeon]